jgi:hypothetical protein
LTTATAVRPAGSRSHGAETLRSTAADHCQAGPGRAVLPRLRQFHPGRSLCRLGARTGWSLRPGHWHCDSVGRCSVTVAQLVANPEPNQKGSEGEADWTQRAGYIRVGGPCSPPAGPAPADSDSEPRSDRSTVTVGLRLSIRVSKTDDESAGPGPLSAGPGNARGPRAGGFGSLRGAWTPYRDETFVIPFSLLCSIYIYCRTFDRPGL